MCILILVVWLVFAGMTASVADRKGRSGWWWFIGGLFFGIIAYLIVLGVGDKEETWKNE